MSEKVDGRVGVDLCDQLGPLPEHRAVVAYLYHDATTPELADPLLHSTLVVMWRDRRPTLRNETPLITLAQAEAMVAAERERIVGHVRGAMGHAEAGYDDVAWRLLESLCGPNVRAEPETTA